MLVHAWLAVAVAVAVTRHGLYEIDRLFNRTLVYVVLTALLAGTYALVAVLAGQFTGGSAFAASAGTLAAALAFRPLRDRLQTAVDRRFARRRVGRGAAAARLPRRRPRRAQRSRRRSARRCGSRSTIRAPRWSSGCPRPAPTRTATGRCSTRSPIDGRARSPIGHDHREVGVLLHDPALAERPDVLPRLLDAGGLAIEIARLRVELRRQLDEVDSSRTRIVAVADDERRRIERDLHDGAQQRLVSIGLALRHAQHQLGPSLASGAARTLDGAVAEIATAIDELRELARGLRPAQLDAGLGPALRELAARAPVPVTVTATTERFEPSVETAAYFVACEGLTNAVKHARAGQVALSVAREDGRVVVSVADDGVGGAAPANGSGLTGLADRVGAQGGTLRIDTGLGRGTKIVAEFPCAS